MLSAQEAEQTAARVTEQQARLGRLARAVYQGGGSLGNVVDAARRAVPLGLRRAHRRPADRRDVAALAARRPGDRPAVLRCPHRRPRAGPRRRRGGRRAGPARPARGAASCRSRRARPRPGSTAWSRSARPRSRPQPRRRPRTTSRTRSGSASPAQLQAQLAAQARRRPRSGAAAATGPPSRPAPGTLEWPVHGPITSPFGMRVHPVTGVYKLHTGADIGASCGTPIHAALARHRRPGRLEQRLRLAHRHLPRCRRRRAAHHDVQPPDRARRRGRRPGHRRARPSARSGSTGYSTGCHLHLELYVNSALVDPVPWLPAF